MSRGRSPTVKASRIKVHNRKAAPSATTSPPAAAAAPRPAADFVPYVRTDEVLNQDPVDAADDLPTLRHSGRSHAPLDTQHFFLELRSKVRRSQFCLVSTAASPFGSAAPPAAAHKGCLLFPDLPPNSNKQRQQEILRGLAQLRQVSKPPAPEKLVTLVVYSLVSSSF